MAKAPTAGMIQRKIERLRLQEAKIAHIDEARNYVKHIIRALRGYATSPNDERRLTLRDMLTVLDGKVAPYDPDQIARAKANLVDMFESADSATTDPGSHSPGNPDGGPLQA